MVLNEQVQARTHALVDFPMPKENGGQRWTTRSIKSTIAARGVAYPHTRGAQPRRDGVWGPTQALAVTSPCHGHARPRLQRNQSGPRSAAGALRLKEQSFIVSGNQSYLRAQGLPDGALLEAYGALWSDGVDNGDLFGRQTGQSHGKPAYMDSARPWVKGRLLAGELSKTCFFLQEV